MPTFSLGPSAAPRPTRMATGANTSKITFATDMVTNDARQADLYGLPGTDGHQIPVTDSTRYLPTRTRLSRPGTGFCDMSITPCAHRQPDSREVRGTKVPIQLQHRSPTIQRCVDMLRRCSVSVLAS